MSAQRIAGAPNGVDRVLRVVHRRPGVAERARSRTPWLTLSTQCLRRVAALRLEPSMAGRVAPLEHAPVLLGSRAACRLGRTRLLARRGPSYKRGVPPRVCVPSCLVSRTRERHGPVACTACRVADSRVPPHRRADRLEEPPPDTDRTVTRRTAPQPNAEEWAMVRSHRCRSRPDSVLSICKGHRNRFSASGHAKKSAPAWCRVRKVAKGLAREDAFCQLVTGYR